MDTDSNNQARRCARGPVPQRARQARRWALTAGLLLGAAGAWAQSLSHSLTDLPNAVPGQDLWRVDLRLQGPLPMFNAVNLLFAPDSHAQIGLLGNPAAAVLDLAPITQPDPGMGTDGMVTLTALSNLPSSFVGAVALSFVWTGAGSPGAVRYEVLDDGFGVLSSGLSSPTPVPEPASWALLLAGAGLLLARARTRR